MVPADEGRSGTEKGQMKALVISVGTELISGEITDTNASWLSRQLAERGIRTALHICVGDDEPALSKALLDASKVAEVVIVTGGIGPTPDDITRQAVARAAGVELIRSREVVEHIEGMFRGWGREMPASNAVQADFPQGSVIIDNPRGTAAGHTISIRGR